ncbi:hypothetical protein C8R44DRAFT_852469 [Mycena epipterygia]|nr:hypothetical protein C8R44DRAFT_852469 [Mycena epipterygia]
MNSRGGGYKPSEPLICCSGSTMKTHDQDLYGNADRDVSDCIRRRRGIWAEALDKVTPPLPFAPPSPSPLASPAVLARRPRPPTYRHCPHCTPWVLCLIRDQLPLFKNVDSECLLAAPKSGGRAAATS